MGARGRRCCRPAAVLLRLRVIVRCARRFAARALDLDNFYTTPMCSTTRAEVLTGRDYPRSGTLLINSERCSGGGTNTSGSNKTSSNCDSSQWRQRCCAAAAVGIGTKSASVHDGMTQHSVAVLSVRVVAAAGGWDYINANETTMPELLRAAGYYTMHFGKW